jgi:hypothetical protein
LAEDAVLGDSGNAVLIDRLDRDAIVGLCNCSPIRFGNLSNPAEPIIGISIAGPRAVIRTGDVRVRQRSELRSPVGVVARIGAVYRRTRISDGVLRSPIPIQIGDRLTPNCMAVEILGVCNLRWTISNVLNAAVGIGVSVLSGPWL